MSDIDLAADELLEKSPNGFSPDSCRAKLMAIFQVLLGDGLCVHGGNTGNDLEEPVGSDSSDEDN